MPEGLVHHAHPGIDPPAVETGTVVARPRVLHRRDHAAAVVLTRLSAVNPVLSVELLSIVEDGAADAINAREPLPPPAEPAELRAAGPGPSVAVLREGDAFWAQPGDGSFSGRERHFSGAAG